MIPTPGCVLLALYSFLRMCVESLIFTNSCARINIELEELCAHVAFAVGRGCQPFARLVAFFLFPAHAGVISLAAVIGLCSSSETFSPHLRGCSRRLGQTVQGGWLFPAYAGVTLFAHKRGYCGATFPCTRRGDPNPRSNSNWNIGFSPHMRG